jgi:hypothetical protein
MVVSVYNPSYMLGIGRDIDVHSFEQKCEILSEKKVK